MKTETKTDNQIIAEFMGVNYYQDEPLMKTFYDDNGDGTLFYCEWHPYCERDSTNIMAWVFDPGKNWCQLMPVVEKIETMDIPDHLKHCFNGTINTDIEVAYSLVVEFIKWFNLHGCIEA